MEIVVYILRCILMFLVTWVGVRLIGKKSIANMTSYDLAALMLLTTVAAEPLVFKISSKATIGVTALTVLTIFIGHLSLKEYFYNLDMVPTVLISHGKILRKEVKKARMNIPLLMSELRVLGYQDLSGIAYAILEPNGKISAIPTSQTRPLQPSDMDITTSPVKLSFPIIIDGELKESNLTFLKKDKNWLMNQVNAWGIEKIEDVLMAQMDSKGNVYIDLKEKNIKVPKMF